MSNFEVREFVVSKASRSLVPSTRQHCVRQWQPLPFVWYSSDILYPRRSIHFELSLAFSQEVLDGTEISLIEGNILPELGPVPTSLALDRRAEEHSSESNL
jgi:hypothetical protein